jgi:hypothetical protein
LWISLASATHAIPLPIMMIGAVFTFNPGK